MPEFIKMRKGGVRLLLDDAETDVIRRVTAELRALIASEVDANDPVVDRLFPSAYEDERNEQAYRELVGEDLVRYKLEALDAISTSLGEGASDIKLEGDALAMWLASLTDLRLAIGTRLDVDEDRMAADIDPRDPNAQALSLLHWLGWIQEGLLRTTGAV
jgi:hypothetical protein